MAPISLDVLVHWTLTTTHNAFCLRDINRLCSTKWQFIACVFQTSWSHSAGQGKQSLNGLVGMCENKVKCKTTLNTVVFVRCRLCWECGTVSSSRDRRCCFESRWRFWNTTTRRSSVDLTPSALCDTSSLAPKDYSTPTASSRYQTPYAQPSDKI